MRRVQFILIISILLGANVKLLAQSKKYNKEEKNTFLDADSYYVYGDFYTAVKLFKQIYTADEDFQEINFKLGDALFQLGEKDEALTYLQKGQYFNTDSYFLMARVYLSQNEFEQARSAIQDFEKYRDEKQTNYSGELIKRLKSNVEFAEKQIGSPELLNIINLGDAINSEHDEYVPLISSDETLLLFTSRRLHSENKLDPTGRPYEDVYESHKVKGVWQKANLLKGEVNTNLHDASVGLSPDGKRLYTFRTNENLIGGDLYESLYLNGAWTTPIRMSEKINNYESIEPSASISLDGQTFYFSSNRAVGFGGFDLYRVVKLPNGEWSEALNLGEEINTPFDEDAPFIHPDGKSLYFSSKGHDNMGGFDLFKSEQLEDGSWNKPENLGYPTNTTEDDIYFVISANEQHGYYASEKEDGFGGHDIYRIDYLEKKLRQSVIKAKLMDETLEVPLAGEISLVEVESGDLVGIYQASKDDGEFIFLVNPNVSYQLTIQVEGYEEKKETIQYKTKELLEEHFLKFSLKAKQGQ